MLNFNFSLSSLSKGESLLDTVLTLKAMQADLFVIRHNQEGIAEKIAEALGPNTPLINGGDGRNEHPTQALLDMLTLRHYKPNLTSLKVAIIGDIINSRVARSEILALKALGVPEIRIISPETLLPKDIDKYGAKVFTSVEEGIQGVDAITVLRLQRERMQEGVMPNSKAYFENFGLTNDRLALAKRDAIVMHPGPINRGVEIESAVADCPQSVILQQVTFGVAVRMAVMAILLPTL